jgi:hypothetical protein
MQGALPVKQTSVKQNAVAHQLAKQRPSQQARPFSVLEQLCQLRNQEEQPSPASNANMVAVDLSQPECMVDDVFGLAGRDSNNDSYNKIGVTYKTCISRCICSQRLHVMSPG